VEVGGEEGEDEEGEGIAMEGDAPSSRKFVSSEVDTSNPSEANVLIKKVIAGRAK